MCLHRPRCRALADAWERAAAGRHYDKLRLKYLALIGGDAELRIADALDRLHHLAEMKRRLERLDLLHQCIGEPLARHHGHGRDVVDWLFGIKLGALSPNLVEDVDEMSLDVEEAELEYGKKTAGPGADDEYVSLDGIGHACSLRPRNDEIEGRGSSLGCPPGKERFWS